MNDVFSIVTFPQLLVFVTLVLVMMVVWFMVNRASVRANDQIKLLQELVEQQHQQTLLLEQILYRQRGDRPEQDTDLIDTVNFKHVIPKR